MNKSIVCINPICGKFIPVPEGAVQVVCGECNTLHFISETDLVHSNENVSSDYNSSNSTPPEMDLSELDLDVVNDQIDSDDAEIQRDFPAQIQDEEVNEELQTAPREISRDEPSPKTNEEVGFLVTRTGEYLPLKTGVNIIGRSNADLIISDKTVSRKHCVIEATKDASSNLSFVIYDIGHTEGTPSTNGVYLTGRTLRLQDYERVPLKNGVTIEVGSVHLDFLVKEKSIPD